MQSYICGKFIDKYLIASRYSNAGLKISKEMYKEFKVLSENNSEVPLWVINILVKEEMRENYGKASIAPTFWYVSKK